jgi:mRNA interferase MazF
VIERGAIHWADLGPAVVTAAITSNTALAAMPGNVFLPAAATGLPRDSTVDVTACPPSPVTTSTRSPATCPALMQDVDRGLSRVLDL